MSARPGLEIYEWEQQGYQPLVFSHDWQVALLNWKPAFELEKAGEIERHNQTDEVFVLVKGQAVLFTLSAEGEVLAVEMTPHLVYNVTAGTWHNLIATRDASWVIVENRGTHLGDTELRRMTAGELAALHARLPKWAGG
jgi:hypothetical protein